MRENLLVFLLMCSTAFLASQTIAPKKCGTCGKSIIQCQYKGRHPVEREKSTTQSKQNQDKSSFSSSSSVSKNNSNRSQNIWVSFTCYVDNVTIYIDGKYHGSIDKKVLLSNGSHKLKAVAPNYYTKEMTFEVNNNNYVVHISLDKQENITNSSSNRQFQEKPHNSTSSSSSKKLINIKGKVTDRNGIALRNIKVSVKGSGRSTTTDSYGSYTLLSVPFDESIVFERGRQKITLDARPVIDVTFRND